MAAVTVELLRMLDLAAITEESETAGAAEEMGAAEAAVASWPRRFVRKRGESIRGKTIRLLKKFTTEYLDKTPEGREKVKEYYRKAPVLVRAIPKGHPDWVSVANVVDKSVALIREGKFSEALDVYEMMSRALEGKWLRGVSYG